MEKDNIRIQVEALLEKKINEIFLELQDKMGITSGDIDPSDAIALDDSKENMTKIITDVIWFEMMTNNLR